MRHGTAAIVLLAGTVLAPPGAQAGGPSAVLSALSGQVGVRPLTPGSAWHAAQRGPLVGDYLVRTRQGAWAHLNGNVACIDGSSLIRIHSNCGYRIEVLCGHLSAV